MKDIEKEIEEVLTCLVENNTPTIAEDKKLVANAKSRLDKLYVLKNKDCCHIIRDRVVEEAMRYRSALEKIADFLSNKKTRYEYRVIQLIIEQALKPVENICPYPHKPVTCNQKCEKSK